jgi:hypothetical protein
MVLFLKCVLIKERDDNKTKQTLRESFFILFCSLKRTNVEGNNECNSWYLSFE